MKKIYLSFVFLFVYTIGFSQNNSDVKTSTNPSKVVVIDKKTHDFDNPNPDAKKNPSKLVIDTQTSDLPSTNHLKNLTTISKVNLGTSDVNQTIPNTQENGLKITKTDTRSDNDAESSQNKLIPQKDFKFDSSTNDQGVTPQNNSRSPESEFNTNTESCSFTGTLTASDLYMTSRLLRPGAPTGNCGQNYTTPAIAGAGSNYYYDLINISNTSENPQCVNFSLVNPDPVANIQFAVYNNYFNPSNVLLNYIGDPGISSGTPAVNTSCNITVPDGANYVVVIFNVNASQAMTTNYTLNVSGLSCAPTCSFTGTLLSTDTSITSRLLRPGAPTGSCGLNYTAPSITGAGSTYYYDTYNISNSTGYSRCVTFSLNNPDPAANLQFAVYNNTFNPSNITQNYLGDPGISSGTPAVTTSCTITIPNGSNLVLVVFNVNASQAMTTNYTLDVTGLPCPPTCSYSGTLLATDAIMTSRLSRPGAPTGSCGLNYASPTIIGSGSSYYYDTINVSNTTGYTQCVNFSLVSADPVANIQFAVYNNSFNPSNLIQNYLGDPGLSSGTPATTTSCNISIPDGAQLVVVIFNVNASQAMTTNYTLNITGLPCPESCTYTSTLTTADPVMTSRLLRPGAPTGSCGANYLTPSIAGAGSSYYYEKLNLTNQTGFSQCVNFSLVNPDPAANLQFAVYNNTFNPNNITQNYLGDPGLSSGTPGVTTSCNITIPNGANIVVVIFNVNASQAMTTNYTFTVTGLPCPPTCSYEGTIASTDAIMTSRILRPGAPTGSCGTSYTAAAITGAGSSYYYDKINLTNQTGSSQCVTFSLVNPDPEANLQFAVYNNTFNPADPTQNYLGDPGLSSGTPAVTTSCTITIPNGANIVVVVFNVNASQAMTTNYTLNVSGLPCPPSCTYVGTVTTTDNALNSRLLRPGAPTGSCGSNYTTPSTTGAGSVYYYDTYNVSNTTGYSQCVNFSLTHTDPEANLQLAVYNNSFNPNNLAQNYLGDPGISSGTPAVTTSCNITVPNGANLVVVVFNVNASQAMTTNYTITVTGLTCDYPLLATDDLNSDLSNEVIIYPNPTDSVLYIKGIEAESVRVFSIDGKQMKVNLIENRVETQELSTGVYLIQIIDSNQNVITKRFMKE